MARFKYMGEFPVHGGILVVHGPCFQIRLPKKDGTVIIVDAPDPINGFIVGADIGVDIIDSRAIRILQMDSRFEQIS